jgi:ribosomal protein L39E
MEKYLKLIAAVWKSAAIVLVAGLFFVIIEGLSSTTIAIIQALQKPPTGDSQYDEMLGWTGRPGVYIPDLYGKDRYVRTNQTGFRNESETGKNVPEGKLRVICAGDSFTYGQGVANHHTWCHHLSEIDGRLDTVNMGQPGYGVDQIFLRYSRDGIVLDHSILIFAFVRGDLDRMAGRSKNGYGKPVLKLDNGELVVDNVPVPHLRWSVSRVLERADLRSIDIARRALARLFPRSAGGATNVERLGPVAAEVFRTIKQLTGKKNVVPVFIYLPTEQDLRSDPEWRHWVAATMDKLELPFIDLTPHLRATSAAQAGSFFIPPSRPDKGHYTESGNEWVAKVLYDTMMDLPQLRTKFIETEPQ